jgi:uncharacterized membrane protein
MTDTTLAPTPPVERQLVTDLVRRGLIVAPAIVLIAAVVWGLDGALSALYGLAVVLVNFALSGAVLSRTSKWTQSAVMAGVMGGFVARMLLVLAAITVAGHFSWVVKVPLGLTLVITHLGLLFWETRYLSVSLAFPALKPKGNG